MKIASILILPCISLVQNVFAAPIREPEGKSQQQQQKKHDTKLAVVSKIFKRTLEEHDIQAPVGSGEDEHAHHDLYRISRKPQLQCHRDNCILRGEANIAPKLLDSIKKRVGVINFNPAFYRRPDYDVPEREGGATAAGVTEVGVLTDTRILTHTSPVHSDHVPETGKVVDGDRDVAFIMLNSNPDAYFQHGETSVPIVEGSLVSFDGRTPHNTVVNSGYVHILGPFEMGASWISGQSTLNTVGGCIREGWACENETRFDVDGSLLGHFYNLCCSEICESSVCLAPTPSPTTSPTQAPSDCPADNKFSVDLLTDSRKHPKQVKYKIKTKNLAATNRWDKVTNGWARGNDKNTQYTFHHCLDANKCHKFVIKDKKRNGLCCANGNGNYKLTYAGNELEHVPFNQTYFDNISITKPNKKTQRIKIGKCRNK